jgi:hypothetical protein
MLHMLHTSVQGVPMWDFLAKLRDIVIKGLEKKFDPEKQKIVDQFRSLIKKSDEGLKKYQQLVVKSSTKT